VFERHSKSRAVARRLGKVTGMRIIGFLVLLGIAAAANGHAASILVNPRNDQGEVSPLYFGDSLLAVGGSTDVSNLGLGMWNPAAGEPVAAAVDLARERGMTVARFPGGTTTLTWNWKTAIGSPALRPNQRFGIAEFMETCEAIGAEPVFVLSYFAGTPQDYADLVEYLNAPAGAEHPYATIRNNQGHPEPYGVVYFEFGNETFLPVADQLVHPDEYVAKFNDVAAAMKAVDPNIRIGVVTYHIEVDSLWNRVVLEGTKDLADFVIEHTYSVYLDYSVEEPEFTSREIFETAFASPEQVVRKYRRLNAEVRARTGRTDLPLAITEHNSLFLGDLPVPYRYSLGSALLTADILRVIMQPESNVLLASYWSFINEYFGSVSGPVSGAGEYVRRPAFLVFSLYKDHFGTRRIPTQVSSETYSVPPRLQVLGAHGEGIEEALVHTSNLIESNTWIHDPADFATVTDEDGVLTFEFEPSEETYTGTRMFVSNLVPERTYRFTAEVKPSRDTYGLMIDLQDSQGNIARHNTRFDYADEWNKVELDLALPAESTSLAILPYRLPADQPDVIQARNFDLRLITPETLPAVPYLSVNSSKSADGSVVYLMVLNKNQLEPVIADITVAGYDVGSVEGWVLSGPTIDATNETDPGNVKIVESGTRTVQGPFEFTFAPHSLTALEIHGTPLELAPADINGDGAVDAVDVQLVVNRVLGVPDIFKADVNGDKAEDAIDVQLVVNAVLGL
jgi:alpha-N-arabinofuranosidase